VLAGLREGDRIIIGNFGSHQAGEVVEPKVTKFTPGAAESGGEE